MRYYCGIAEKVWNSHPTAPGLYACISPVSGRKAGKQYENWVRIPSDTLVIQDSGAFSDNTEARLTPEQALERQIAHAEKHNYAHQIELRASYDLLIDEKWINGDRKKKRWSEVEAETAVKTTIEAAEYMVKHNTTPNILSVQGVTPKQYLACAERIMPLLGPTDVLGLGGWCIIGICRSLMPVFYESMSLLIPKVARRGIKRVHLWGVIYADAVGRLQWLCDQYEIEVSTDSVGPHLRPALGRWGYADWVDPAYKKVSNAILGLERARHVAATRDWLDGIASTRYYKPIEKSFVHINEKRRGKSLQLAMF